MKLRENYTAEDFAEYKCEILEAEKNNLELADLDGWIDLEKLLGERMSYDDYYSISSMLFWEHDIDTIGINDNYDEKYIRTLIYGEAKTA